MLGAIDGKIGGNVAMLGAIDGKIGGNVAMLGAIDGKIRDTMPSSVAATPSA